MRADKIQKIKKKRQGSGAFEKAKVPTAFGTAEQETTRETLREETEKNVTLRGNEITVTETENRKYSRQMRSLQAAW